MLRLLSKNVHLNEHFFNKRIIQAELQGNDSGAPPPPKICAAFRTPNRLKKYPLKVIPAAPGHTLFIGRCSLKIQIESIGLPTLSKLIGKKSQLEMPDGTVADLVLHIVNRNGSAARKILLDQTGQLDLAIQVMINDEGFLLRKEYAQRLLKDGDAVKFMLLVGGG
jgi:sulfur carrier protein ThiS